MHQHLLEPDSSDTRKQVPLHDRAETLYERPGYGVPQIACQEGGPLEGRVHLGAIVDGAILPRLTPHSWTTTSCIPASESRELSKSSHIRGGSSRYEVRLVAKKVYKRALQSSHIQFPQPVSSLHPALISQPQRPNQIQHNLKFDHLPLQTGWPTRQAR